MSMVNDLLNEKRLRLEKVQDELVAAENAVKSIEYDIVAAKKKQHRQKLVQAGKIIEDAGLLNRYDPDELYLLLIQHKKDLLKK